MTFHMNEAIARERRAALYMEAEQFRLRRAARRARRSRRSVRLRSPIRAVAPASQSPRSGLRPTRAVMLVAFAGAFLVSLDVSIANALLPSIGATFRTDDRAALAWVITAYAIVYAAVLVPAGQLADRLGRRRVYRAGMYLFALGSVVCGLAPDLAVLIGGRAVQGSAPPRFRRPRWVCCLPRSIRNVDPPMQPGGRAPPPSGSAPDRSSAAR